MRFVSFSYFRMCGNQSFETSMRRQPIMKPERIVGCNNNSMDTIFQNMLREYS